MNDINDAYDQRFLEELGAIYLPVYLLYYHLSTDNEYFVFSNSVISFFIQDEKDQVMHTNVWLTLVSSL